MGGMRMTNLKNKLARAFFAVFLSLMILSPVYGQTGTSAIHVSHLVAAESEGPGGFKGVSLTWDFLLLDDNTHVIANAAVDSATVTLQDGDSRDAQVEMTSSPWPIVILVDAGLNMANAGTAFKDATQTLSNSLEQLPDGSNIAILKYSAQPATVQKFTTDKKVAQKALLETLALDKGAKKSCLNNGIFEGINMLGGASSRRALLLLTASGDNCENHSTNDVVQFAQENKIQIYAVGIEGQPVTQKELEDLSAPTGGLTALKQPDLINFAFGSLFDPLKNQWQARATLYPSAAGQQTAQLKVILKDKTSLESEAQTFKSLRSYSPPPEIKINGQVLPTFNGASFSLNLSSRSLIQKLDIFVENVKTGGLEYSQVNVKIPAADQPAKFDLVIPTLVQGDEYTLRIEAVDINGGKLGTVTQNFKYQPQGQLQVQVEPLADGQPEITARLKSENLGSVGKYVAWLAKECSSPDEIPGTRKDVPLGDPYTASLDNQASGTFHVVAQAVDLNNQVLMTSCDEQGVKYVQPGWWARTTNSLVRSPLAIAAFTILAVIVIVLLVWVIWVWRKRSSQPKAVPIHFPKVVRNAPAPSLDPERGRDYERRREPERSREPEPPPRRAPEPELPPRRVPTAPLPSIPASVPPAWLRGDLPSGETVSAQIATPLFRIGRAPEADLMIRVDKNSGVSRIHATIQYANGSFFIEDASSFGTFVDGQKINKGSRSPLNEGAVIQLGPTITLTFSLRDAP